MKINIFFPFIDYRKLDRCKIDLLVGSPCWPDPDPDPHYSSVRTMGMININQRVLEKSLKGNLAIAHTKNGIKLCGKPIPGLKGLNRELYFPFSNDIFGVYAFSFFFQRGSFAHTSLSDVFYRFVNEISFTIKDLCVETKGVKLEVALITECLKNQYYWATRKLTADGNRTAKIYDRDKNGKISISSMDNELKDIVFIKPYFFVETSSDDSIKDNEDFMKYSKVRSNVEMGTLDIRSYSFIHSKRGWFSRNNELKMVKSYLQSFEYYFLFFEFLKEISKNKFFRNQDRSSVYIDSISRYLVDLGREDDHEHFESWLEYYMLSKMNRRNVIISQFNRFWGLNDILTEFRELTVLLNTPFKGVAG
jgi:hypothetical protein